MQPMAHKQPLQDQLPRDHPARICFGCGADNTSGLQIKSFMQGDTAVCRFRPDAHHTAFPGVLNGGIVATLLDCHGIWTAVGYYNSRHLDLEVNNPETMFVTRKMTVEYLRPTPMDTELLLQGRVVKEGNKSMQVEVDLWAGEEITARADVLAVRAN
jgi:acyl-coenzyme A thioesterase PaaI-like protein